MADRPESIVCIEETGQTRGSSGRLGHSPYHLGITNRNRRPEDLCCFHAKAQAHGQLATLLRVSEQAKEETVVSEV